MAQGAGASDPEPRALRGAATAPRVTSGPRGRAQAEADRARTPPGRPLQLSARRLGKLCECGGRKHRSPEAGAASRSSCGRGWPPAGPWRAGRSAPPAPRGPRPRLSAEGTFGNTALQPPPVPSAFGRLSTSGRLRTVCPNSVYGRTLLESLCVRRLWWETRRVRSAGPAATSGPVLVLVRPELSSVLPDVSRIPRPSVRRRRELHTCGNHSVSVLATGLHHRAPSSSVRTCRSGSERPSWLGLKPPRPPWQGARAGRKPQLRGPGRAQASGPAALSFTRPPPGERRPRGRPGHAGPEALSPPPAPRGPRVCCEASAFLFLFFFSVGRTGWWAASLTGP